MLLHLLGQDNSYMLLYNVYNLSWAPTVSWILSVLHDFSAFNWVSLPTLSTLGRQGQYHIQAHKAVTSSYNHAIIRWENVLCPRAKAGDGCEQPRTSEIHTDCSSEWLLWYPTVYSTIQGVFCVQGSSIHPKFPEDRGNLAVFYYRHVNAIEYVF